MDTVGLILASFQHAFAVELGQEVAPEQVLARFGEPLRHTMVRVGGEANADRLVAAYRQFNRSMHDQLVRPFPGVQETVQALHAAGLSLAVTTSKVREVALMSLRLYGLDRLIPTMVAGDDVVRHKPDPEAVRVTLERLGRPADAGALMVGDSPFDLQAGRQAGIRTCAVGWSIFPREQLEACAPDFWAQTPAELQQICLADETTA